MKQHNEGGDHITVQEQTNFYFNQKIEVNKLQQFTLIFCIFIQFFLFFEFLLQLCFDVLK